MERLDILLVEDNEDDIELTLLAFKRNGIGERVFVCRDGAEALDFLFGKGAHAGRDTSLLPRLILLDLKLPKVDGFEVLKAVRAAPWMAAIPIVMLTSSSRKSDLDAAYKLGANSYLVKSVDFDQFLREVAQLGQHWLGIKAES